MKHFFAFAVLSLIALSLLAGCNKNKKPAVASKDADPKVTEVAPAPPVHQAVQPQAVQPVVTPVTTVTPVVDPIVEPVAAKAAGNGLTPGQTYTVQKGDTLWSIAVRAYGDGKQYKKIVAANPSIKGDKVGVGQKITLP